MSEEREQARDVLDLFLFEDLNNNNNFNEEDWGITWQGDNFVLLNYETGKLFPFHVSIEPHAWDYRQAVEDQEWHLDYDLEGPA